MKSNLYLLILFALTSYPLLGQEEKIVLYFDFDSHVINPTEKEKIHLLTEKDTVLRLIGYADYVGKESYNKELALKRAKTISSLLPYSSIYISEGETKKYGARKENRRVEIIYRKKENIRSITNNAAQAQIETVEVTIEKEEIKEPIYTPNSPVLEEINTLEIGQTLAIKNLEFYGGRHYLKEYSLPELEKLLNTLKKYPNLKIEIQGHICCKKNGEDGLDFDTGDYYLSTNRARSIYNYLVYEGIDKNRLKYRGFASTKPLVEEVDEASEQKNRRVEILLLDK